MQITWMAYTSRFAQSCFGVLQANAIWDGYDEASIRGMPSNIHNEMRLGNIKGVDSHSKM